MYTFLHFTQKLKMATKNDRKTIFGKNWQMTATAPRVKIFVAIALFHTFSELNVFLHFTQNFKINVFFALCRNTRWLPKVAGKQFWQKLPVDCRYHADQKFCQNHSISHHFRHVCILRKNSRWPPKMTGKRFLAKNCR